MSPWNWLGDLKPDGVPLEIVKGSSRYPLNDAQRQFIVVACRAFQRTAVCHKCGGLSWDIPLEHYCTCEFPILAKSTKEVAND